MRSGFCVSITMFVPTTNTQAVLSRARWAHCKLKLQLFLDTGGAFKTLRRCQVCVQSGEIKRPLITPIQYRANLKADIKALAVWLTAMLDSADRHFIYDLNAKPQAGVERARVAL